MKKLLIIIVAASIFLHFYPQPELEKKYLHYKNEFSTMMAKFTGTQLTIKANKIYQTLAKDLSTFNENEINTLKEITLTKDASIAFFEEHCQQKASHTIFQPQNLEKVCTTIGQYRHRF